MMDDMVFMVANGMSCNLNQRTPTITVVIHTNYGDVRIDSLTCAIMKDENPSPLLTLGRATCERIGIDVHADLHKKAQLESFNPKKTNGYISLPKDRIKRWFHGNEQTPKQCHIDELFHQTFGYEDDEVINHLENNIELAKKEGLSSNGEKQLREVIGKYKDLFQTSLSNCPPARVTPMKAKLKLGYKPVKAKARKYSPEAAKWMSKFIRDLEDNGLIYRNNQAVWASPAMPRLKPDKKRYRLVVDLRQVNSQIELCPYPIPYLESVVTFAAGAYCYATCDLQDGYWQFPLAKQSQELFTFVTHEGLYSPTRIPQGSINGAAQFQACVEDVLKPCLRKTTLVYIDDILIKGTSEKDLLKNLDEVFHLFHNHGIKLSAKKQRFFVNEVKWCGKVLSGKCVKHDPSRVQGLLALGKPIMASELFSYLAAVNWMRASIPEYSQVSAPLYELFENA
ncbi:MAG: reverse transcriptase family protein, partial [Bacteroidota bacterium]